MTWLMGKCYLPTGPKDSADMIRKLDAGVVKFVSIGFYAPHQVQSYDNGTAFKEYVRGPGGERAEPQ